MQDYVIDAITLAMRRGGRVHNRELKSAVAEAHGLPADYFNVPHKDPIPWQALNEALKDEPMENGMVFVPHGEYWYLNPSKEHYVGWLRSVVRRHEPEQRRIVRSFEIGDYAGDVPEDERKIIRENHAREAKLIARWTEEEAAELERELQTV